MPILTKIVIQCDAKDCESTCEADVEWHNQDRYPSLRNITETWKVERGIPNFGKIKYWCDKHAAKSLVVSYWRGDND
jgi:hypothetical protein